MVYLFLADGFEEVEALATLDFLRRADIEVLTVGISDSKIKGSHSITVECDITEDKVVLDNSLEAIILPGGMPGTINLENSETVQKAVKYCLENDIYIASICAAPSILGHIGALKGKEAICYPGFEKELEGATISEKGVVTDGKIITGKAMGYAIEFGAEIVKNIKDSDTAEKIMRAIL